MNERIGVYVDTIRDKISQVPLDLGLRKKVSLFLLNALSQGRQILNQHDVEDYFYETTGVAIFSLKTIECRRDRQGKVTMLRLESSDGQMRFFNGDKARLLRESIALYAPKLQVEEK